VEIAFDPTILQVVDDEGNAAEQIAPGSALPTVLANAADNVSGTIHFGAGIALGEGSQSGALHLATIRFKALKHTSTGLQGTPVETIARSEAYLAGVPQLTGRAGSAIVVSMRP